MSLRDCNQESDSDHTDTSPETTPCNSPIPSQTNNISIENLIDEINSLNLNEMTTPVLKREYLEMIPEFTGDNKLLARFIEICEKLVNKFYNKADITDFQNEYLMSSILSKIKGDAAINIASCNVTNWDDLKQALINTYADKRDCFTLNIELTELKQTNESAFEYFNKVQELLNLQISYITTQIKVEEQKVLIGYFQKYAVRILLRGLKEPLGTLMRTKKPEDMSSALNMLTNDFQLDTHSHTQLKNHIKSKHIAHNNVRHLQQTPQRNFTNTSPSPLMYSYRPTPNNALAVQRYNNNNNNPPRSNVFKPNPQKPLPKPTPMSISTKQSFTPRASTSYNQQRPQQYIPPQYRTQQFLQQIPKFTVEELYNTETYDEQTTDDSNVVVCEPDNEIEHYYEPQLDQNNFLELEASDQQ